MKIKKRRRRNEEMEAHMGHNPTTATPDYEAGGTDPDFYFPPRKERSPSIIRRMLLGVPGLRRVLSPK
jgi:hypothetical protein